MAVSLPSPRLRRVSRAAAAKRSIANVTTETRAATNAVRPMKRMAFGFRFMRPSRSSAASQLWPEMVSGGNCRDFIADALPVGVPVGVSHFDAAACRAEPQIEREVTAVRAISDKQRAPVVLNQCVRRSVTRCHQKRLALAVRDVGTRRHKQRHAELRSERVRLESQERVERG